MEDQRSVYLPFRRPRIAVLEVAGGINGYQKIHEYVRLLERIRESPHLKALVLDIDSRGGSATGSDNIFQSIRRVAERKPVVAFVSGLGASGAYMLACAAQHIVCLRSALVGSIGVRKGYVVAEGLMERLGTEFYLNKVGHLKDSGSFHRRPTEEDTQKLQEILNYLYERFVGLVAQQRGLAAARVRELATGELYPAEQALSLGLIDELGDFERALEVAGERAGIQRRITLIRPKRTLTERVVAHAVGVAIDDFHSSLMEQGGFRFYY